MAKNKAAEVQTEVKTELPVEAVENTGPRMAKKVSGITKDSKLTVISVANPKRSGSASYDRFNGYLSAPAPTTVQEALDNGLTMGDIQYDVAHGYITVAGAEVIEYEVTPRGTRSSSDSSDKGGEAVEVEGNDEDF